MRLEEAGDAPRLGLIEQLGEERRRVRFIGDDEHIDATAAGIEHVPSPFARHIDVGHEGCARHSDAQLAYPLEVRSAVDVQIEDDHIDWPALTGAGQRRPVLARNEAVPVTRRTAEARESGLVGEERRYYTHATVRLGKSRHWVRIASKTPRRMNASQYFDSPPQFHAAYHAFVPSAVLLGRTTPSPFVLLRASTVTVPAPLDRLAILDAVFHSTPDLVAILAPDGTVMDANRRALAFADVVLANAIGMPLAGTPGWQRRASMASWLDEAVLAAADGRASTRMLMDEPHADEPARVLHFTLRPLSGTSRNASCLHLLGADVTACAMAEQRSSSREQQLRMLTDNMHDLLFLVRVEAPGVYRAESVNRAYLRVTGMREEEVVGHVPEDVLPAAQAAVVRARYDAAMISSVPLTYTEVADVPSGRLVVETTLTVVRNDAGTITHLLGLSRDVSEKAHALDALRDSEARFRAALDAGYDAFVIANAVRDASGAITDFVIVDAITRAAALSERPVSAMIGLPLLDAFPMSRDTQLLEQCHRVAVTGLRFEMAQSAPVPDVPGRWVQRQIVPMGDGVAISSRDVSDRQRELEALEASERRHRQLFESSGVIQLLIDEQRGELIDANAAAERFYGWPREAMRAMQIGDLDRDASDAWRSVLAFARVGRPDAIPRVHRIASGELRDVELSMSAIELAGRAARHVLVHDVSDRVRAESQLRESEALFRAVVSGMREGVVVYDASGAIRSSNPSAQRLLGLTDGEGVGASVTMPWPAVKEDGSEWPQGEHPAMIALRTGRSQAHALMGIRHAPDDVAWVQVGADPLIRPGQQEPYGAVAVFSDVTAQRGAEERLREAQKLEAVGQLAGGIAHDFNNLLTVIRGAAGFLVDSLAKDSRQMDDVRAIERAAERAEELTRRLLAIGRRQLLRTESVDLGALVQEQSLAIRNDLPRAIRLQMAVSDERVLAQLDRRQVLDALRALIDNSRQAMPDGGSLILSTRVQHVAAQGAITDGALRTGQGKVGTFAVLEVRDTGIGMSDDVRAKVFEPFFSTQPFGTSRGMGLASVHGMVAQSGGFIECDSAPGRGTAMRLFFPLAAEPVYRQTPRFTPAILETRSVLMVDDDPLLRDLGQRMLERLGRAVSVVGSGREALRMLEANVGTVSVLVTDLTMPEMSGMELITEVERRYPMLPIVAISGFAMNPTVRQELDGRRIPFVGKPFTPGDFAAAMDRAIGHKAKLALSQ